MLNTELNNKQYIIDGYKSFTKTVLGIRFVRKPNAGVMHTARTYVGMVIDTSMG